MAWIEDNQLGRRNLTPDQFRYYLGRQYERVKRAQGAPEGNQNRSIQCAHFEHIDPKRTAKRIATEHGVGQRTVRRAAECARDLDEAVKVGGARLN